MQQQNNLITKAREAKVKARRNLRDAEIDHDSGLISGEELAEFEHTAKRAEANVRKAEAEEHEGKKERSRAALKARFDAAMDRAKDVRVDGFDALTDMTTVERMVVGRTAAMCIGQVAWLEKILMSLHVQASQRAGEESQFDVRQVSGEGQDAPDSLLHRIDQIELEIAEYETLAVACEQKYYALSDECVKQGTLTQEKAAGTPYFRNASNYGEALNNERRNQEQKSATWARERAANNEKVRSAMPDIDQLLASRQ